MQEGPLIARFGRARRDASLAVLEGFHPLKHALRFGASVTLVVSRDTGALARLAERLAPELAQQIAELVQPVRADVFEQLAPLPPSTGVIALAERRTVAPATILGDPRDLGNMGACVRVAAAADAAGVLSTGSHDPWAPDALRGAAGLHYALPVARLGALDELDGGRARHSDSREVLGAHGRPLLALDPDGEPLLARELPPRALLAFGTERYGVSDELLACADARVSIPMRAGVSSLNLATSVAAVLFAWRLAGGV